MKKILSYSVILLLVFTFYGCKSQKDAENISVKVLIPKGTPQVALIEMIKNNPEFSGYDITYEFPNSNDLITSSFMSQDAQIIVAPSNLGAIIHNRDIDYRIHGVLIWGSLYLVSNEIIESLTELSGVEITSIGKGLTTDVLLNYLLKANQVENINIKYASAATELVPLFISEQSKVSLMPEPSLSVLMTRAPDTNIVMDFGVEWKKITGLDSSYPQAAIFINEEFRKNNDKFVQEFNRRCIEASRWVNENPDMAGIYFTQIEEGLSAEVVASSIPRSNIDYVLTANARESLEIYYGILFDDNPANIGGSLPDERFYFEQ